MEACMQRVGTWRTRRGAVVLAALVAIAAGLFTRSRRQEASATPSSALVINEVYGGGGNSGATLTNDFIEVANRSTSAADVDGWSVQYHSGSAPGTWQPTALSGPVPAGGIYLVGESQGTGGTQALPPTQASGTIAMSATAGTVALVHGTDALTCTDSASCESDSTDLVGYGTAGISETGPAPRG